MKRGSLALVCAAALCRAAAATAAELPSVDDLVGLKRAGSPAISPDGRRVAYTVREADWTETEYRTQLWLADVASGSNRQLTRAKKSRRWRSPRYT